jgi:hypothetical protein
LKSVLAWLQALIQNPSAAPPKGLRLGDLANLWRPAASDFAVASSNHARLTKLESLAGPSAAGFATPHRDFDLTPRFFAACRASWEYAPITPYPVRPPTSLPSC